MTNIDIQPTEQVVLQSLMQQIQVLQVQQELAQCKLREGILTLRLRYSATEAQYHFAQSQTGAYYFHAIEVLKAVEEAGGGEEENSSVA